MKKNFILILIFTTQTFLTSCIAGPDSAIYQREMNHMNEYLHKDQTERNKFHQKQAAADLTGCPILIRIGRWEYSADNWSKDEWTRQQSWMYPDGMVSETPDSGMFQNDYPQNAKSIYIGPWKYVELEYGSFWNRKKIKNDIRYIAFQGIKNNQFYSGFEFKNDQNKLISEKAIKLLDSPVPDFARLCEVKWIAKYGYNAIFDAKSGKIIEMKE